MREQVHAQPIVVIAFNNKVFGLDRTTGEQRWRVELGKREHGVVELAIDDTTVIACSPTELVFLDYLTGNLRKRVERVDAAKGMRTVMLIDRDQVLIVSHGVAACYSLYGDLLWNNGFTGEGYGEAAIGLPHRVRQADYKGQ